MASRGIIPSLPRASCSSATAKRLPVMLSAPKELASRTTRRPQRDSASPDSCPKRARVRVLQAGDTDAQRRHVAAVGDHAAAALDALVGVGWTERHNAPGFAMLSASLGNMVDRFPDAPM